MLRTEFVDRSRLSLTRRFVLSTFLLLLYLTKSVTVTSSSGEDCLFFTGCPATGVVLIFDGGFVAVKPAPDAFEELNPAPARGCPLVGPFIGANDPMPLWAADDFPLAGPSQDLN